MELNEITNTVSTYVTKVPATESAGQVIGFDNQLILDLVIQLINTALLIVAVIFIIWLCMLGIKALRIYIKKNS
nr:hypothetical protein [uncultured Cellulosilyticum sp.]